jgi:hypothetical protein
MHYAILIYGSEDAIAARTKEALAAATARHVAVRMRLNAAGQHVASMRLMPTTAATTLRTGGEPLVIDGPFAETKEQLLGAYIIDCQTLDEAIGIARDLGHEFGSLEIRPIAHLNAGLEPT